MLAQLRAKQSEPQQTSGANSSLIIDSWPQTDQEHEPKGNVHSTKVGEDFDIIDGANVHQSSSSSSGVNSQQQQVVSDTSEDQTLSVDLGLQKDNEHSAKGLIHTNLSEKRPRQVDNEEQIELKLPRTGSRDRGASLLASTDYLNKYPQHSNSSLPSSSNSRNLNQWGTRLEVKPSFQVAQKARALKRELKDTVGYGTQAKCPRGLVKQICSEFHLVKGRPPEEERPD